MKEKIFGITIALVLLLSYFVCPIYAVSQSDLDAKQQEIDQKKEEQEQVQQELSSELTEISRLDASIKEKENEISALEEQISEHEDSIKEKEEELDKKQKEHKKNQELMENRLVVMYETGETTFLDMLFASENIIEFISNYYMLSQVTQCDKELLETIEHEQEQITEVKEELENEKEELDASKREKEAKANSLKVDKQTREEKASSLSEADQLLESEIAEKQQEYDRIEASLKASTQGKSVDSEGIAGLNFDGSFIWPCDNTIVTSCMKIRWGRWHKGIDIGARYEYVYAAASGYAYPLENPGGYGHYIIVFHGNGYATLYGHLDTQYVSYGEYVSQGEIIAISGNSGSSTGPHLHFEVREASSLSSYFNEQFLDPLDYLPGGYSFTADAQISS